MIIGFLPMIIYLMKGNKKISYINFLLPYCVLIVIGGIYESIATGVFKVGITPWFRIFYFTIFL